MCRKCPFPFCSAHAYIVYKNGETINKIKKQKSFVVLKHPEVKLNHEYDADEYIGSDFTKHYHLDTSFVIKKHSISN